MIEHLSNGQVKIDKTMSIAELTSLLRTIGKSYIKDTERENVSSLEKAKKYFESALGHEEREIYCAAFLDNTNKVIAFETLFKGTLNQCPVFPREILKKVIEHKATSVILAHNHPGDYDLTPSISDIKITTDIITLLKIIDVDVLDHILVGGPAHSISIIRHT